ncbi:MAG: ROK family protein [Verrucomicrobiales bacterium]
MEMNMNGLKLVAPKILPVLDPAFRPASLAHRNFEQEVKNTGNGIPTSLAIEQADGTVFHFHTAVFPETHPSASGNFRFVERLCKFLLWSRGGFRIHFAGPETLYHQLRCYYTETKTGQFDAQIMGDRIYGRPFEVVRVEKLPPARESTAPLGRHMDGCRIGFDLGGSDRKVAAVIDGKTVFSEEVIWHPIPQKDPQWHYDEILSSLKRAAEHLPRVDAIGGSSAGVYVNNTVRVASLFRGVPPNLFESRVKNLFLELAKVWNVPFEIANDGEVTALAGSMSLGKNSVLGLAFGTSTAGGYVTRDGNITSWLNELAFVPVDYNPNAAVDEWSTDYGCGVQYFSQQCVGRLLAPAGIALSNDLSLAEKLKEVQKLMDKGDDRALRIYQTIGTYMGYGIAHFANFYQIEHVLVLGRVTSGPGGDIIVNGARDVLKAEFPELAKSIQFHLPDEKEKRHGQAMAAASLPAIKK